MKLQKIDKTLFDGPQNLVQFVGEPIRSFFRSRFLYYFGIKIHGDKIQGWGEYNCIIRYGESLYLCSKQTQTKENENGNND